MKSLPLITGLAKAAWLRTWFRNNWLRMAVAGCGLHCFIYARFLVRFELLQILVQSIDVFCIPMKIHAIVLKIKKQNNLIFSSLIT